MGKPGNKIHIPLPEKEELAGLLAVKPTDDTPRCTQVTKAKSKRRKMAWMRSKIY